MARNLLITQPIGMDGKESVKRYFFSQGWSIKPSDVAPDHYVDFVISKGAERHRILVRTDTRMWYTWNVVIERFMHRRADHDIERGWYFTSQTDWLCYLDAVNGTLYILDWPKLKELLERDYRPMLFQNKIDDKAIGEIYRVPVWELSEHSLFLGHPTIDISLLEKYKFPRPLPF